MGGLCRSAMCEARSGDGSMSNGRSRDWDRGNPDCMRSTYPLPGFPRARLSLTSISGPSFLVLVPRRPATVSNRCPDAIPVVMPQTFTENEASWCGAQFGLGLTSTRLDSTRGTHAPVCSGHPSPLPGRPAGSAQPYSSLSPSPAAREKIP